MLLELKAVGTPPSTATLIVFPFDRCKIKFRREVNTNYLEGKYTENDINQVLDNIEKTCDNFCSLKKYILMTMVATIFFIICMVLGGIYLNKGLGDNSKNTDVDLVKYDLNQYVYIGGIILGLGGFIYCILMTWIGFKSKKIRLLYEERIEKILTYYNQELKGQGMKWRLGDHLRWIELILEFKIKVIPDQISQSIVLAMVNKNHLEYDQRNHPIEYTNTNNYLCFHSSPMPEDHIKLQIDQNKILFCIFEIVFFFPQSHSIKDDTELFYGIDTMIFEIFQL